MNNENKAKGYGEWVRVVSQHDEGAVSLMECKCSEGSYPRPLDVVEVTFKEKQDHPSQPENWYIDTKSKLGTS